MPTLTLPSLWRPPAMFPPRRRSLPTRPALPSHAPRTSRFGPWWRLPKRLALFATHLASKGGHLVRTGSPPYHLTTDCGGGCTNCPTGFHSAYRLVVSGVTICTGCLNYTDGSGRPYHYIVTSATINGTWDLPFIGSNVLTILGNTCFYTYELPGFSADIYGGNINCTPGSYAGTFTHATISLYINSGAYEVQILGGTEYLLSLGIAPANDPIFQHNGTLGGTCIDSTITGLANAYTSCPSSNPPMGKDGTVDIIPL